MKRTELNNGLLAGFLERYRNVRIKKVSSLFEVKPVWKTIEDDRCPFCNRKLKFSLKRPIVRCTSPHCVADPKFIIRLDVYKRLKSEIK